MSRPFLVLLLVLAAPRAAQEPAPAPAPPPSVLLIVADDLGYGDLGCYGQQKVATPNLDRLAAEGLRFTEFYAGGSVCIPSRGALVTGKHTGHAWLRTNTMQPLPESETTVAELLRARGLATAVIGKWALGNSPRQGSPLVQGFDTYYGFIDQVQAHRSFPAFLLEDDRRVNFADNELERTHCTQELFTERALAYLQARGSAPFFLLLSYTAPHADLDVPEDAPELAHYRGLGWDETPFVEGPERTYRDQPTPRAARAAMLARLDRDVGRLLDALRALGREQDTLVLFTSDNGASPEGGADLEFFRANGGLRGGKGDLYEGGIRVPLLARWPGRVPPGTCAQPAAAWDLLPTLVELAGGELPVGLDGVSLVPALTSAAARAPAERPPLYWEHSGEENWQALRHGAFKLVRRRVHTKSPALELYDLATDPGETRDLAAARPELAAELLARLEACHVPDRRSPLLLREINPRAGRRER